MRRIIAGILLFVFLGGVVLSTMPRFTYAGGNPTEPTPTGPEPEPPSPPDD
jgi:hypothetical protein